MVDLNLTLWPLNLMLNTSYIRNGCQDTY